MPKVEVEETTEANIATSTTEATDKTLCDESKADTAKIVAPPSGIHDEKQSIETLDTPKSLKEADIETKVETEMVAEKVIPKAVDSEIEKIDHDYEDVTPLNSVIDEKVIAPEKNNTEVVDVKEEIAKVLVEVTSTNPPVASPRNKKDSFVETKEEIVDDLEFIKAKLTTPPIVPAKAKRASKEVKEADVKDKEKEVKEVVDKDKFHEVQLEEVKENDTEQKKKETEVKNKCQEVKKETVKEKETAKNNKDTEDIAVEIEDITLKEKVDVKSSPSNAKKVEEFSRECIPPMRPTRSRRAQARISVPDWRPPKQSLLEYVFSCFRPNIVDQ
jgi:hypothetical protein